MVVLWFVVFFANLVTVHHFGTWRSVAEAQGFAVLARTGNFFVRKVAVIEIVYADGEILAKIIEGLGPTFRFLFSARYGPAIPRERPAPDAQGGGGWMGGSGG